MTEPKDYFINPCCFGDDLTEWLIGELLRLGIKTDEKPGQEDFGWYLNFEIADAGHNSSLDIALVANPKRERGLDGLSANGAISTDILHFPARVSVNQTARICCRTQL